MGPKNLILTSKDIGLAVAGFEASLGFARGCRFGGLIMSCAVHWCIRIFGTGSEDFMQCAVQRRAFFRVV